MGAGLYCKNLTLLPHFHFRLCYTGRAESRPVFNSFLKCRTKQRRDIRVRHVACTNLAYGAEGDLVRIKDSIIFGPGFGAIAFIPRSGREAMNNKIAAQFCPSRSGLVYLGKDCSVPQPPLAESADRTANRRVRKEVMIHSLV